MRAKNNSPSPAQRQVKRAPKNFVTLRFNWLAVALGLCAMTEALAAKPGYVVVVSAKTRADSAWNEVVGALESRHSAEVFVYQDQVEEVLPRLRKAIPRFVCFVAQPQEAGREFVASAHQITRRLDDDPYPDCFWGIVTGYDAANALRIAKYTEPLTVRKVASGTQVALELCEEGICYDELVKGKVVKKEQGGRITQSKGPEDSTKALVSTLNDYQADLFIASGHATERDWQIGYAYRSGFFHCEEGVLYGEDTKERKYPIHSPNPKVYLPVGNCLMGHIDDRDAMALAWMNSAGVNQMIGYTVETWYGYAGWGCLDYFVEQPGRYSLAEAFLANQISLIYRLKTYFPGSEGVEVDKDGHPKVSVSPSPLAAKAGLDSGDMQGLLYDRDHLAFYGDPAWVARMAPGATRWDQSLEEKNGVWTFTIRPKSGEKTFEPVNENGSQRGGRPIIEFLPTRVPVVEIMEGANLNPVIADNFLLVPNPLKCDPARQYKIVFRAKQVK
jgi:zinc protease